MRKTQSGSAQIIIVIVLVVVILGALGFVFYQKVIANSAKEAKKAETTLPRVEGKDSASKTPILKTLAMNTVFTNGLSLQYPQAWSVTHKAVQGNNPPTEDGTTSDSYILTSPDNSIDLSITQAAGGGIGGACSPEEEPTLSTYSYEISSGWSSQAYADYVRPRDTGYIAFQQLGDAATAKTIVAGDSVCKVQFLNVTDTGRVVGTTNKIQLFTSISEHGVNESVSYATLAEAKAYLTSQNAADVKSILLSLK